MGSIVRKNWLDACKALAIIFVIFAHAYRGDKSVYFTLTSAIKLPLFFIVSGYLFAATNKNMRSFFLDLLQKIVVPWSFFAFIQICIANKVRNGNINVIDTLQALIEGRICWYIPCYIVSIAIFYILKIYFKKYMWLIIGILTYVGLNICNNNIVHFFQYNIAFVALLFLYFGYIYHEYEYKITEIARNKKTLILLAVVYFVLAYINLMTYPEHFVDMHHNQYNNFFITASMAVIGAYGLFMAFSMVTIPIWLIYIGSNTLMLYLLEGFFRGALKIMFQKLGFWHPENIIFTIMQVLIVFSIILIFVEFLKKYFPMLIGRKSV